MNFAARYPAYSLIPSQHEFASPEGIFLKAFQSGGQYYPGFVSGTRPPQLPLGQLRKLARQTVDVFRGGVKPHAVGIGLFDAVAQRAEQFLVEVYTGEPKPVLYGRPNRAEFFENKGKRIPSPG
jgi:hypothetical protein